MILQVINIVQEIPAEMNDKNRGIVGYHEFAKILASKGYSTSRPDVDEGIDMLAIKNNKIALIQLKTVVYTGDSQNKSITASGSKNGKLSLRYKGLNLVILCMDEQLNRIYSLVFSPSDIPSVQCLWVPKVPDKLSKYAQYKNKFDNLEFNTFQGSNPKLTDF